MNPDPRLGNEDLLNLCEGEIKPTWVTAHLSPSLALPSWHSGGEVTSPHMSLGPLKVIHQACVTTEFTLQKHEARTSKQLLRGAPTSIKLDP